MRQGFNFYSSYDEVISELNDKQLSLFVRAVLDVQFLRIHIDDITFEDKILSITWKAIKYSIFKQVDGYCKSNKQRYDRALFGYGADLTPAPEADLTPAPRQVQVQEEVQVQVQVQVQVPESDSSLSATRVAKYLLCKIVENKPNFKQPATIDNWAKDIEKAIRIDHRTENQLIGCIDWIYSNGTFWIANIKSGKKLRQQFDSMESQMMRGNSKNRKVEENLRLIQEIRDGT